MIIISIIHGVLFKFLFVNSPGKFFQLLSFHFLASLLPCTIVHAFFIFIFCRRDLFSSEELYICNGILSGVATL